MGEIIAVASGKGGVGKTSVTANIGDALAALGKKVLLIDMDMGLRNLDLVLGLESEIVYDAVDMLEGRCRSAVLPSGGKNGPDFIPASQIYGYDRLSEEKIQVLYNDFSEQYDYILIDCPAGIEKGFCSAASGADSAMIVTSADAVSLRDAERTIGVLEGLGIENVNVVINRFRTDFAQQGIHMKIDSCIDILSVPLLGVVPEDDAVAASAAAGMPVCRYSPDSQAAAAYRNIAARITGEKVPLMQLEKNAMNLKQRIKKLFGR